MHYIFPLPFSDADKKPANDFMKLTETKEISKGILFNVQQSLLQEWGPDSLGVLPDDMMQELLIGKFSKLLLPHLIIFYLSQLSFILTKTSPIYLYLFLSILFLFQGLNLPELAAHLEHKVAQLP